MNKKESDSYESYVKSVTPTAKLFPQMAKAFLTGGLICCLGQFIQNTASEMGASESESAALCSLILILLSVLLTGLNIFPSIVKFGGAGALVPITGFANSVCAPAIEYKAEGHVFGIGCKIFTIAGPVILYGIFSSFCLGCLYYLYGLLLSPFSKSKYKIKNRSCHFSKSHKENKDGHLLFHPGSFGKNGETVHHFCHGKSQCSYKNSVKQPKCRLYHSHHTVPKDWVLYSKIPNDSYHTRHCSPHLA